MTVAESLKEYRALVPEALKAKMQVRGYVSTAFGCPYEGKVAPKKALCVIETVADMGVCELSIGDTIGVATPRGVIDVIKPAYKMLKKKTAVHFHDTRGTALANALQSLEIGVRVIDSSAGGLGGCPYAPGASGNLATEDLVYMLHGMGFKTGINLDRLSEISIQLASRMNRPLTSKYVQAYAKGNSKK
jgi:isopropylmalate/homocitrate/citramalate synthase